MANFRGICLLVLSPLVYRYLLGKSFCERVGRGAHTMIVLDRSASMNDNFADKPAEGEASKMAVARRVLQTFVSKSREDLLGMVRF